MCKNHIFVESARGSFYVSQVSGSANDDVEIIAVCTVCGETAPVETTALVVDPAAFEDSIPF